MLKNAILGAVVACLTGLLPLVGGNGTATAADAKTDWPTYTSAEGKYKVSMPDKPQVTTQDLGVGKLTMAMSVKDDGGYFTAHMTVPVTGEVTPELAEVSLDGVKAGVLGNMKGSKVISETKIKLANTHPGRDLLISTPLPDGRTGLVRLKVYMVDKTLYQVMVLGSENFVKSKASDAFFDSFTLTK